LIKHLQNNKKKQLSFKSPEVVQAENFFLYWHYQSFFFWELWTT